MNVVVTGAGQGIGEAIAKAFATEPGVRLFLTGRRLDPLIRVAETCEAGGARAVCLTCDVTRDDQVRRMADCVLAAGAPDVLVNNAGGFSPGSLRDTEPEEFRQQIETNLTSAFLVSRSFVPAMLAAGRDTFFFLGSVASLQAYPGALAYCAAKHGLLGLSRAIRDETRGSGVRVTALLPGATWTPSWAGSGIPASRMMPAADIARSVVELHRLGPRTVAEEIVLRPQQGDV